MILQVGVKILLQNPEGKYLLLKRNSSTYPGMHNVWDIPGGRIDPGTSLLVNLRREILEETQLPLTSEPQLLAAQDIIQNAERHVVRLTYRGMTTGEPTLDPSEHTEYIWVTLDELRILENLDAYVTDVVRDKLS
jgi:8-oxo-dGTP diphosphatase